MRKWSTISLPHIGSFASLKKSTKKKKDFHGLTFSADLHTNMKRIKIQLFSTQLEKRFYFIIRN